MWLSGLRSRMMGRRMRVAVGALAASVLVAGSLASYRPMSAHAEMAPPAMPANVHLNPSSVTTDGTVVLTWDAPATMEVDHYQIFRFNGSGTAKTDEVTFLARTPDARLTYTDRVPTEGYFQYAVVAVDKAGKPSQASAWVGVNSDFPANGVGTVTPDVTLPAVPGSFRASAPYAKNQSVSLSWTRSVAPDLWRYIIYRQDSNGTKTTIGYAAAEATSARDPVQADGAYQYYIVAQDTTGNVSAASTSAAVIVDGTAPAVAITVPVAGQTYPRSGTLTITATVTDAGSGYEATSAKYYLDGLLLTSPTVNLATMAPGGHTVKVEATDRAGNTGSGEVQFSASVDAIEPTAPLNLTAPAMSKSRSVALSWAAPISGTITGYSVYRAVGTNQTAVLAGTTTATVTSFTDPVQADGTYSYYVVANNGTAAGPASNMAVTMVDSKGPEITITAPASDKPYANSGTVAVVVTLSDALSGVNNDTVKYWLDGQAFTGSSIDLAKLGGGRHTFKVDAADRAGNVASGSVSFMVGAPSKHHDDDDDDDDEDDGDHDGDHQHKHEHKDEHKDEHKHEMKVKYDGKHRSDWHRHGKGNHDDD